MCVRERGGDKDGVGAGGRQMVWVRGETEMVWVQGETGGVGAGGDRWCGCGGEQRCARPYCLQQFAQPVSYALFRINNSLSGSFVCL